MEDSHTEQHTSAGSCLGNWSWGGAGPQQGPAGAAQSRHPHKVILWVLVKKDTEVCPQLLHRRFPQFLKEDPVCSAAGTPPGMTPAWGGECYRQESLQPPGQLRGLRS